MLITQRYKVYVEGQHGFDQAFIDKHAASQLMSLLSFVMSIELCYVSARDSQREQTPFPASTLLLGEGGRTGEGGEGAPHGGLHGEAPPEPKGMLIVYLRSTGKGSKFII